MPTLITKTYGAGRDFQNAGALATFVNAQDPVAIDQFIEIILHESLVAQSMGPQSSDDTRRIIFKPAPGLSVNELEKSSLNEGSSGISITWNRSESEFTHVGAGIDFYDLRVIFGGTNWYFWALRTINHHAGNTWDTQFVRCRLYDNSSSGSSSFVTAGAGENRTRLVECLLVNDGSAVRTMTGHAGTEMLPKYVRCTMVARGVNAGSSGGFHGQNFDGEDCVFVNYSGKIASGGGLSNCYANVAPGSGVQSVTVVTGAGVLVANEANDFRPAAGSVLIGAGSASAVNTIDMFGGFRGEDPDVGPVMRTAAAVPAAPDVTITSVTPYGQKVVVAFTASAPVVSSVATLAAAGTPNGAVTKTGTVVMNGLSGTATFLNCNPGNYAVPTVIATNPGGTGTCSGGIATTIPVPAAPVLVITSRNGGANTISLTFTVTEFPTSGTLTVAGPTNTSAPLVINDDGTGSITLPGLTAGTYTGTVSVTNFTGTDTEAMASTVVYAPGQQPPGLPAVTLQPYVAPAFNSPSIANGGVITTLTLENETGATATNQPFTIGHPFKKGQLKPSDSLIGKIAGQSDLALQFDPKTTWPDGSVQHGIISGVLPTIAANALVAMDLTRSTAARDNTPVSPATIAATSINALVPAVIGGVTYTADADAALTAGTGLKTWLAGPVCTEYTFEVPFKTAGGTPHQILKAQFAVRYYSAIGRAKVDVTVENCDYFYENPSDTEVKQLVDITYDVAISVGGATAYSKSALVHWPARRWYKSFWFGGETALHVKFDRAYLSASRMVSNYDPDLTITESRLAALYTNPASSLEPMSAGPLAGYMPASGARWEIAVNPQWVADWIVSQDKRARKYAVAAAMGGGAFEAHVRNRTSGPTNGQPLDVIHFPSVTYSAPGTDSFNAATSKYEVISINNSSASALGFQYDTSHGCNMAGIPYMLTGDFALLEELIFWANFNTCQSHPAYREREKGLYADQPSRAQGWNLRTMAFCAALTPDAHPLKAVHCKLVDNNLSYYNEEYTDNPDANVLGLVVNGAYPAYAPGQYPLWQDDYITSAVGVAADMGFAKAEHLMSWKARFAVGRMIAPGTCWMLGSQPNMRYMDAFGGTVYSSFAEVWDVNFPPGSPIGDAVCGSAEMAAASGRDGAGDMGGNATSGTGYPSTMQPALAYAVDYGFPDADLAWTQFMSRTVKPTYTDDGGEHGPGFAIVPRALVEPQEPTAPSKPASVTATAGNNVIYVTGTVASSGGSPVTGYYAEASTGQTGTSPTLPVPITVPNDVAVTARLAADNVIGRSELSDPSNSVTPSAGAPVSTVSGVTVSPSTATGSTTFSATVAGTNSPSQAVTWGASAGSITSGGVFTAPAATGSIQTITITATSVQDGTKSGTATVTIAAAVATVTSVTLTPATITMATLTTQQFAWQVNGTNSPSQAVTLSASAGSIDSNGLFTRPARTDSLQSITITATSVFDNTKSTTATVTILALPITDERLAMAKLDATQFINLLQMSATAKRSLTTLFDSLITDIKTLRDGHNALVAKLDADAGVTATDYAATTAVPDSSVILGK